MNLRIDGVAIKRPSNLGFERYNLTKSGRVASGKMTMDIIAKKRKFTFAYDVISGNELDKLLEIIDSNQAFFNLTYEHNGKRESAVVYAGSIKYDRFRINGGWYYKGLTFDLIEQ